MTQTGKQRVGGGWQAALLALIIGGAEPLAQGFRQDELECEEALAYLDECCDGFDPTLTSCDYVDGCDKDYYPTIAPTESQCIRKKSCAQVQNEGVCARAIARQQAQASSTTESPAQVCQ